MAESEFVAKHGLIIKTLQGNNGHFAQLDDSGLVYTSTITQSYIENLSVQVDSLSGDSEKFNAILNAQEEPTGFPNTNQGNSSISFDDGTRTFSISGSNEPYWIVGQQFFLDGVKSIEIPDIEGIFFFYIDETETLQYSNTFTTDLLKDYAYVANVYWDADSNEHLWLGDERHGLMPWQSHVQWHTSVGTIRLSGLGLTDILVDENGNNNSHAQFSTSSGVIRDEDISFNITGETQANLPFFYQNNGKLRRIPGNGYISYTQGGRALYNDISSGTLLEINNNDYGLHHIFATNDPSQPYINIIGQGQYQTKGQAESAAATQIGNIILSGLATQELLAVATVIIQTSNIFSNDVKTAIVSTDVGGDYVSWLDSNISQSTPPSDHNNLTNRDAVNSHPAYSISYTPNVPSLFGTVPPEDVKEALDDLALNTFSTNAVAISANQISIQMNQEDIADLDDRIIILENASISASDVFFDNSTTTLVSIDTQGAIEELDNTSQYLQTQIDSLNINISAQPISADNGIVIPFTNSDLISNIVTLNHSLNEKYVIVEIYDNNDNLINSDYINAFDGDNVKVDLSSYTPINGTWHAAIHSSKFVLSADEFSEVLNTFSVETVTSTDSTFLDYGTFAFHMTGTDIVYTIPDATIDNEGRTMKFFVAENTSSNSTSIKTVSNQNIGESATQELLKLNTGFTALSYDGKWNIIQDNRSTKSYIFQSPEMDSPNNSDWAVNSLAPAAADSTNAGIIVRTFDDTIEEGVGFNFIIPKNSSFINIYTISKSGSTQSGNVIPKLYFRTLNDNSQISSWSSGTTLNSLAMTSNQNWQYDSQTFDLSTLGVPSTAKQMFVELTRDAANGSDNLVGDWVLLQIQVEIA